MTENKEEKIPAGEKDIDFVKNHKNLYNLSELTRITGIPYNKLDKNFKCHLNSLTDQEIKDISKALKERATVTADFLAERQKERRGNL